MENNLWKRSPWMIIATGCVLVTATLVQAVQPEIAEDGTEALALPSSTEGKPFKDTPFGQLARETIIDILNIIRKNNTKDFHNTAQVCKSIHNAVLARLKSIRLRPMPPGVNPDLFKDEFPNLKEVCVTSYNRPGSLKTLFAFLPKLGNFTTLNLNNLALSAEEFEALVPHFPKSLEVLQANHNAFGQIGIKALAQSIAKGNLPNLKLLSLHSIAIENEGITALAPNIFKLTTLNLSNSKITNAQPLIDALNKEPSELKEFIFYNNKVKDEEMGRLISALPQDIEIVEFFNIHDPNQNLESNQESFKALSSRSFPALRQLDISAHNVNSETVQALVIALGNKAPKLQKLTLRGTRQRPWGNTEMAYFSRVFQQGGFSNLQQLFLHGHQIGDVGIVTLMKDLPLSVQSLGLHQNGIGPAGVLGIIPLLPKGLKEIYFRGNPFDSNEPAAVKAKKALEKAVRRHPQLRINMLL